MLTKQWPDGPEISRVIQNAIRVITGTNRKIVRSDSSIRRFRADFKIVSDNGEVPAEEVGLMSILMLKPRFTTWFGCQIGHPLSPNADTEESLAQLRSVL
jgi:hypothetical protein